MEEEEDDWGEDTSEEAQSRRMDEISDHAKVLILRDDLERTVEDWANILFDFVKKKKEEGIIDLCDKEIVAEAEGLDVKAMGPLVLTGVLFKEEIREHIRNTGTMSQQQKSSMVPSSWFDVWGSNAPSSPHLQDSTYLEGDV